MTIRLVVADDSMLVREGIARVLTDRGFEIVGEAGDGEEPRTDDDHRRVLAVPAYLQT